MNSNSHVEDVPGGDSPAPPSLQLRSPALSQSGDANLHNVTLINNLTAF